MVISPLHPASRRRARGSLSVELTVALGVLAPALLPLSVSFAPGPSAVAAAADSRQRPQVGARSGPAHGASGGTNGSSVRRAINTPASSHVRPASGSAASSPWSR